MPQMEELAREYEGRVRFTKINVMENRLLASSLDVLALPTILFFVGGEERERLTGEQVTPETIRARTDRLLA